SLPAWGLTSFYTGGIVPRRGGKVKFAQRGGSDPAAAPRLLLDGLRFPHRAARLGAALALCDRCPCSASLHPPQAALGFAALWIPTVAQIRVFMPRCGDSNAALRSQGAPVVGAISGLRAGPCGPVDLRNAPAGAVSADGDG